MNRRYNQILAVALLTVLTAFSAVAQNAVDPNREKAIDSLALEKVRDLGKYIKIIGNKNTPYTEATRVMDRAEELFAPGSEMGVSSLAKEEIEYYKVREYFRRLMALNYDKVTIEWYDIHYISKLERQPDGRYVVNIVPFTRSLKVEMVINSPIRIPPKRTLPSMWRKKRPRLPDELLSSGM